VNSFSLSQENQGPLTAKQRRGVLLLAAGETPAEVAKKLGVSKGTVYNWKSQNQEFQRELDLTNMRLYEQGIAELRALVFFATGSLRSVLLSQDTADRDRIAAARTVLQYIDLTPRDADCKGYQGGADQFLKRMGLQ